MVIGYPNNQFQAYQQMKISLIWKGTFLIFHKVQTQKSKAILFFSADIPQIIRGFPSDFPREILAEDVERKCCQGCQTISISVMILEQIAKY